MHDRFSFGSLKQHLQWKLPSIPRPPSTLPSPADPQGFPGWTWRAGQRPKFPEMAPAEDLGESQQTRTRLPYASVSPACPGARSSRAWLAVACEQLVAPCIAPPLPLSHYVPQAQLSPAFVLALHAMNQLRVPGGDGVSPPAVLKSFSTKNSWLNKW